MFSLEYPEALVLLLPLLYCLHRCKERVAPRFFVHLHLFRARRPWITSERLLKAAILILLIAALASPVVIDRDHPHNRIGKDIVLCLDASGSMGASGFEQGTLTSRFAIVQSIASAFVDRRLQDNVGIVVYGDFAFIASPITYEKPIVREMIGYLSQGMAGQNTAIGEAIAMGVRAFEHSKAASKVMILLTDGEHNSGAISPKAAVKAAVEKGIRIYTIGIGKEGEYDKALLERIAETGGGVALASADKEQLEAVFRKIDDLEDSSIRSREYRVKQPQFYYLLLPAFILMSYLLFRRRAL